MGKTNWTLKDIENKGLTVVQVPGPPRTIILPELNTDVPRETMAPINKYRNKKKGDFGSIKEWDYYKELRLREKGREVTAIQCQVTFQLSVCTYIADFVFLDLIAGAWVVVDTKSPVTRKLPAYRIKYKMMLNELKIKITEV